MNEILGAAAKERSVESPSSTEESKGSKGVFKLNKTLGINLSVQLNWKHMSVKMESNFAVLYVLTAFIESVFFKRPHSH